MADEKMDMYDTDDYEKPEPVEQQSPNLGIISKGIITTIDVNGQKIDIPSVEYVRETQRLLLELGNRVRMMSRDLQGMDFALKKQARIISDLRMQLDGKIDRE